MSLRDGLSSARSPRGLLLLAGLAVCASLVGVLAARAVTKADATPYAQLDSYSVYRPATLSRAQPAPLVVGCCIGAALENQTRLNEAADGNGFVVAYIAPTKLYNDAERQRGPGAPFPDIQFLSSLIDKLRISENIDPKRVFVTGASAGGVFSYRAACYLSDKVAAIGSVAGTDVSPPCRPQRPVSIIEIHETGDPVVPYNGSAITPAVPDVIAKWRSVDRCSGASSTTTSPGVKDQRWTACANGTAVELITVTGTGHGWIRKSGVDATTTIWRFFAAHPQTTSTSAALAIRFTRLRVVYKPRRRVVVSLSLGQSSVVQARLVHGTKTLSTKSLRAAGKLTLSLSVPRSARPGTYSVVVVARASGSARKITRAVRLTH